MTLFDILMMTGFFMAIGCIAFGAFGAVGIVARRPLEKLSQKIMRLNDRAYRR